MFILKFKKYLRTSAWTLTLAMTLGAMAPAFAEEPVNANPQEVVQQEVKAVDEKAIPEKEAVGTEVKTEVTTGPAVEIVKEMTPELLEKAAKSKDLTILYYGDADNNLEEDMLNDVQEMKDGITNDVNLVVLMDRIDGESSDSSVLGEDFTDTRLFNITPGKATRIGGSTQFPEITTTSNYEANMGDANTLAKLIDFGKANYPADKYVLILSNHGGGVRDGEEADDRLNKAICWDDTNGGDTLYTGEVSDVLNRSHSVDVLGYDACVMGMAELAYQFRPGNGSFEADVMVASAPNEWGKGWNYTGLLSRFINKAGDNGESDETLGGKEKYFSPGTVTPLEIGAVMVEEQRDSTMPSTNTQELTCFDLSKAAAVKNAVDELSVNLAKYNEKDDMEAIRGPLSRPVTMMYYKPSGAGDRVSYPFFDLYDLARRVNADRAKFNIEIRNSAQKVMDAVDEMNAYSFGGSKYAGFQDGKNGVSIFFPDGDEKYNRNIHWAYQYWYSPLDTGSVLGKDLLYGKIKWCQDNIDPATKSVGNWFELLDSWFDPTNGADGGVNGYQW